MEVNWGPFTTKEGELKRGKKTILQDMVGAIDITEDFEENHGNRPEMPSFASKTTLEGWRLSIRSTIDLTEELLNPSEVKERYSFVLSAIWDQDALEVSYFEITRILRLYLLFFK